MIYLIERCETYLVDWQDLPENTFRARHTRKQISARLVILENYRFISYL